MNVICLLGRLTADPEERVTTNGTAVTSFTVAVDRRYTPQGQERKADFINCVAWRQTAEFVAKYFRKGQRIALNGSLQARQFTDKDGNRRTAYEVVVDNVYFAESKSSSAGAARYDSPAPQHQEAQRGPDITAEQQDFEEITGDDDLPF